MTAEEIRLLASDSQCKGSLTSLLSEAVGLLVDQNGMMQWVLLLESVI